MVAGVSGDIAFDDGIEAGANATSLYNLMRNIGGSVGIAMTGTYLARNRQVVGSMLGENVRLISVKSRAS